MISDVEAYKYLIERRLERKTTLPIAKLSDLSMVLVKMYDISSDNINIVFKSLGSPLFDDIFIQAATDKNIKTNIIILEHIDLSSKKLIKSENFH